MEQTQLYVYVLSEKELEERTRGRQREGRKVEEGENRGRECILSFCTFKIHLKVSYKHCDFIKNHASIIFMNKKTSYTCAAVLRVSQLT